MRVGLSWDVNTGRPASEAWRSVLEEIEAANGYGYDSAWMREARSSDVSCSSPSTFMTAAAARTTSIQLRSAAIRVDHHHFVRLAEEVVILDLFSRGRAGISFAAASSYGADPVQVQETIDFLLTAWSTDEFRYCGKYIRFPKHTPDTAPAGASEPAEHLKYVPQWEWGPATPDFLAVTPKPYNTTPPVYVDIADDVILDWAASRSISPFVSAEVQTAEAISRLRRYREMAEKAGQRRSAVEPVLERWIDLGGNDSPVSLGGSPESLIDQIRPIKAQTGISHLVWRRTVEQTGRSDLLFQFAAQVQPMLQA